MGASAFYLLTVSGTPFGRHTASIYFRFGLFGSRPNELGETFLTIRRS